MLNYLLKRLLQAIPLLFGISLISFFMMYLAPGGPTDVMMDPRIRPEDREEDDGGAGFKQASAGPIPALAYSIHPGKLGNFFYPQGTRNGYDLERLPQTLLLMGCSFLFAAILSHFNRHFGCQKKNTWMDYMSSFVAFLGLATPNFWLGMMLIMVFSVYLNFLPAGGISGFMGENRGILDLLKHLILPVITLGTADMAALTRYTRSSMLEDASKII